jgi:hypothetical protein
MGDAGVRVSVLLVGACLCWPAPSLPSPLFSPHLAPLVYYSNPSANSRFHQHIYFLIKGIFARDLFGLCYQL